MIFPPILVPLITDYKTHADTVRAWKSGEQFYWPARHLIVCLDTIKLHTEAESVDIRFYNRKHLVSITNRTYGATSNA